MKRTFAFAALFLFLFVALACSANAATLKGTIFDTNLMPVKSVVSINTTPVQTMVAANGAYTFSIPPGEYALSAKAGNGTVSESVVVVSDGIFNVDLIILGFEDPSLELPSVPAQTGFEGQATSVSDETPSLILPVLGIIMLLVLAGLAFLWFNRKNAKAKEQAQRKDEGREGEAGLLKTQPADSRIGEEHGAAGKKEGRRARPSAENEFQKEILEELGKSEGRMTQKELRKLLPWSEAKVSIELDLLEEKGLVKKIKKGRGNVLILAGK